MSQFVSISEQKLYAFECYATDRPEFELRVGDRAYGALVFAQHFGSSATAHASDCVWEFRWNGFLSQCLHVRVLGEEQCLANYTPHWLCTRGVLTFSYGAVFLWQYSLFKPGLYWLTNMAGELLMTFSLRVNPCSLAGKRIRGVVQIDRKGCDLRELSLLTLLGWYLVVLREDSVALEVRQ